MNLLGNDEPMTSDSGESDPPYILGHAEHELNRLRHQARLLEPITRRYLQEAGVTEGMRVLDVGSGLGDVAFLAAELVGANGEVIGTDMVSTAVTEANRSAQARGLSNVRFREGNPAEMDFDRPFDAVVGRYVLPFQADPATMLRGLARKLIAGGLLCFHEPDFGSVRSLPPCSLYDRVCRWIVDTTRLGGQVWNILDKVAPAFAQAELPEPTLRMQTFVANGPHAREWLEAVSEIIESLLPSIVRLKVATEDEVDLPTLRDRLWEDVTANPAVIVGRAEVGIWTRLGD